MVDRTLVLIGGIGIILALSIIFIPFIVDEVTTIPGDNPNDARSCSLTVSGTIQKEVGGFTRLVQEQTMTSGILWNGAVVPEGRITKDLGFTSSNPSGTTESITVELLDADNNLFLGQATCFVNQFGIAIFPETRSCAINIDGLASGHEFTFRVRGQLAGGGEMAGSPFSIKEVVSC